MNSINNLKEQILLRKLGEKKYSVSFYGTIPDDISLLTKEWFESKVLSNGLTFETFTSLYKESEDEYIKTKYKNNRIDVYPKIEDQLDMLYWDMINGTTKWKDYITEIKNKYPK